MRSEMVNVGMVGYRFNTVGVSDAISMGTDGMSFSLQSRDLIADSVETVMGAQVWRPQPRLAHSSETSSVQDGRQCT